MTFESLSTLDKIKHSYIDLGEKKLLKSAIKSLGVNKVYLYYSKYKKIPICALPNMNLILASRHGFLSFCYSFYIFLNTCNEYTITMSPYTIGLIAKFTMAHEIGHILDPDINEIRYKYGDIISELIDQILDSNLDPTMDVFYDSTLPDDINLSVLNLKKNLIERECRAWNICKNLIVFEDDYELLVFNKIREYALATYNTGNLKSIIKEHNLDTYFKYHKYLS